MFPLLLNSQELGLLAHPLVLDTARVSAGRQRPAGGEDFAGRRYQVNARDDRRGGWAQNRAETGGGIGVRVTR